MDHRYRFETDCISSTGEAINEMRSVSIASTLQEMRESCGEEFESVVRSLGYDESFPIEGDWHVSYHRSWYLGRPCFYLVWSAIEYVFIRVREGE